MSYSCGEPVVVIATTAIGGSRRSARWALEDVSADACRTARRAIASEVIPFTTSTPFPLWRNILFVPEVSVLPIDRDMPLAEAAVVGCAVLTGVGAVFNAAGLSPGDRAAVVGCGGVGLNVIQGAVVAGAEVVIAIDVADFKLELAQTFERIHLVDARHTDPVSRVRELTGGISIDYAFHAAGRISTLEQAVGMTRRGGMTVAIGMPPMGETIAPSNPFRSSSRIKQSEARFPGSSDFARDVPRILGLLRQNRLKLSELVTGRFTLERVNEALDRLEDDRGNVARSVIVLDEQLRP